MPTSLRKPAEALASLSQETDLTGGSFVMCTAAELPSVLCRRACVASVLYFQNAKRTYQ